MKKTMALILTLAMMLVLCGCGKSAQVKQTEALIAAIGEVSLDHEQAILDAEQQYEALSDEDKSKVENHEILLQARESYTRLLIAEYLDFCKENPYFSLERDLRKVIIDVDLVQAYKEHLEKLEQHGISAEDDPDLDYYIRYGQAVVSLEEYEKYQEFLLCVSNTTDYATRALSEIQAVISAGSNVSTSVVYSKFNSAASLYESAESVAKGYDQDAEKVAELTNCFRLLNSGAADFASGLHLNNSALLNAGKDTLTAQLNVFSVLMHDAASILQEIQAIGEPFTE